MTDDDWRLDHAADMALPSNASTLAVHMSADVPAPLGRDLVVPVECTAMESDHFGAVHDITIHADWSVSTPHDLDAERIGRAFGGFSSCLTLVECVVPAYRHAMRFATGTESLDQDSEE